MVVTSDPDALPAATLVNINNAREHFDRLNVGLN